jgi:hypothetical protein
MSSFLLYILSLSIQVTFFGGGIFNPSCLVLLFECFETYSKYTYIHKQAQPSSYKRKLAIYIYQIYISNIYIKYMKFKYASEVNQTMGHNGLFDQSLGLEMSCTSLLWKPWMTLQGLL